MASGNKPQSEVMNIWGTRTDSTEGIRGVARAAVSGASRKELLKEALRALGKVGSADRIGVWIEAEPGKSLQSDAPGQFQGLVWDRENGEMPAEWANLSVEPPLPEKSLFAGSSFLVRLGLSVVRRRSSRSPGKTNATSRAPHQFRRGR